MLNQIATKKSKSESSSDRSMAEAVAKEDLLPPSKKMRTDDSSDAVDSTTDKSCDHVEVSSREDSLISSFEDFEIIRVLHNSEEHKSVAVEGRLQGRDGTAVVMLQVTLINEPKYEFCRVIP